MNKLRKGDSLRHLVLLGLALLVGLVVPMSGGAAPLTVTYPIDAVLYFPCANGGLGEDIALTGEVRARPKEQN